MGKMKICSKCGQELSVEMFAKRAMSSDGLKPACKECLKIDAIMYKDKNKEKIVASCRKYRDDNSAIIKIRGQLYTHSKNAKEKSLVPTFSEKEWKECLIFFNNVDAYTGLPMIITSQDHILPLSKGGNYTRQNIIPCENSVNSSKNNNDMETWFKSQPFYDEERLLKIYKWIGFKDNTP